MRYISILRLFGGDNNSDVIKEAEKNKLKF